MDGGVGQEERSTTKVIIDNYCALALDLQLGLQHIRFLNQSAAALQHPSIPKTGGAALGHQRHVARKLIKVADCFDQNF